MRRGGAEERTLVIHLGGIGDFLLTCPALIQLAKGGPVELAGRPDRLALAVEGGIAEAAHDIEGHSFSALFSAEAKTSTDMLERFTQVIAWMRGDGLEPQVMEGGARTVRFFPGLPPADWDEHASLYYLSCLKFDDPGALRLAIPPAEEVLDVVIHPGSGGRKKNWPLANFVELAEKLAAQGRRITWCRGPAEAEMEIPDGLRVLHTDSLVELGGRLAAAQLYVGNDSGATHLAAAVGCPAVAIFGPTNAAIWGPRGRNVVIVQGSPWPSVEEVVRAVKGFVRD